MRVIPDSEIESATPVQGRNIIARRFVAVEASEASLLGPALASAIAAVANDGTADPEDWQVVFVDVAGAGLGRSFMALAEMAVTGSFVDVEGLPLDEDGSLGALPTWMAATPETLTVADIQAELAVTPAADLFFVGDYLAGAAKGPEFLALLLTGIVED